MIDILKAKIFDQDGNILKKYLNKQYIAKYLTVEEIDFIQKLPGSTWEEQLSQLKKYSFKKYEAPVKTVKHIDPKYSIDGFNFYSIEDFARYLYCKENDIDALSIMKKKKGMKFFEQHKRKTDKSFKRKVFQIDTKDDIPLKVYEKRNSNIKIKLYCTECGRADYQSPRTVLHFNNLLCKQCRRKLMKK